MKKVIKNKEEIYRIWSDYSGEPFPHNLAPVEITLSFNYGSQYDESELKLHFTDQEVKPLLELLGTSLCSKTKKEIQISNTSPELIALLTQKTQKKTNQNNVPFQEHHSNMKIT
jgi:hypothetical protein